MGTAAAAAKVGMMVAPLLHAVCGGRRQAGRARLGLEIGLQRNDSSRFCWARAHFVDAAANRKRGQCAALGESPEREERRRECQARMIQDPGSEKKRGGQPQAGAAARWPDGQMLLLNSAPTIVFLQVCSAIAFHQICRHRATAAPHMRKHAHTMHTMPSVSPRPATAAPHLDNKPARTN